MDSIDKDTLIEILEYLDVPNLAKLCFTSKSMRQFIIANRSRLNIDAISDKLAYYFFLGDDELLAMLWPLKQDSFRCNNYNVTLSSRLSGKDILFNVPFHMEPMYILIMLGRYHLLGNCSRSYERRKISLEIYRDLFATKEKDALLSLAKWEDRYVYYTEDLLCFEPPIIHNHSRLCWWGWGCTQPIITPVGSHIVRTSRGRVCFVNEMKNEHVSI